MNCRSGAVVCCKRKAQRHWNECVSLARPLGLMERTTQSGAGVSMTTAWEAGLPVDQVPWSRVTAGEKPVSLGPKASWSVNYGHMVWEPGHAQSLDIKHSAHLAATRAISKGCNTIQCFIECKINVAALSAWAMLFYQSLVIYSLSVSLRNKEYMHCVLQ